MSVYQIPFRNAIQAPQKGNLAWRFLQSCHEHQSQTALSNSGSSYSYNWLAEQSLKMAAVINQHRQFKAGIHVGVHIENSIEYVVTFYGTLIAGGVVVPIPVTHGKNSLDRLCDLGKIQFVIDQPAFEELSALTPQTLDVEFADPDSLAMLMFTSGSTGQPKVVMLSHRNLTANADSILEFLPIDSSDRTLAMSPFSHALGNSVLQTHLLGGAELVCEPAAGYPQQIADTLARRDCTSLIGVPDLFQGLCKCLCSRKLNNLKYMGVAGGRMDPQLALELQQRISPAKLFLMYGQTEATARLAWLPTHSLAEHSDTIGQAIPGVQLKIVDDSGNEVEPGVIGMLLAKGQNIMQGYFNDTEATSRVLKDGWLATGDLARTDTQGLIKICGRKSGLVKVLGYRFHPNEIEQTVQSKMQDTQIVATAFDFYGNTRVALFAHPIEGQHVSESELKSICREFLPTYMVPQRFKIIEKWPLNSAGKINRKELATIFDCQQKQISSQR